MILLIAEFLLPERSLRTATKTKSKAAATALIAFIFLPAAANASPTSALRDYQSGNFTNALAEYTEIAAVKTNDLRLVFNAGDAAYRATNFDLAQNLFQQVTLSPDLKLQQQAFYNLGNVSFQKAKQAQDLDGLEQGFDAAAKIYERAAMLNTNDADAIFNYRFAQGAAEQVRALKAALASAKATADTAVQRAEFHHAYEIMSGLTQKYKIAEKQFEEFTKKLKDIDDIATPHQP
jgi:tetratricopeptide (TPR) repeat protein